MFTRQLDTTEFGTLFCEGRSKVWEGKIDIAGLGSGFALRVHGSMEGPTAAQATAFARLRADALPLREQATPALVAFLRECDVAPAGISLTDATLWGHLTPCFIEVHTDDGGCSVGYAIPWDEDHLVYIHTLDGAFSSVHSE